MNWNKDKAILHLVSFAASGSRGKCAQYTREAIEAGGVVLRRHELAKDYGPSLFAAGFRALLFCPLAYQVGDVVIISGFPGHPEGHMAMFDGRHWISDFVQRELYPGPAYRIKRPPFIIYRHT